MKLIVGLGNPGKQYEKTRHNYGFMVLDALRERLSSHGAGKWELSRKFNAEICGTNYGGERVILAKPMTFMNESGLSVQLLAHYYKILPADILIIHDDKDLQLGLVKVQFDRGHAGHNGVRSIIERLHTQAFARVRLGIAPNNLKKMADTADFVLDKFGLLERGTVRQATDEALKETLTFINKK
ncbi:MAG TPA: aminoacyl-tRNA hydrolase [Candidatus Magasanikbacteria bacterium]|nr:aminoacyl-tRNA hydrolase [Candidatus Magasanikbacteria bacterium]